MESGAIAWDVGKAGEFCGIFCGGLLDEQHLSSAAISSDFASVSSRVPSCA